MIEIIQNKLKNLPKEPGIYKMLDANGTIIYIGKSKCLKNRVKSYFVPSPRWEKVKKMLPFIQDFEYETTDTHLEAMLLECELIKKLKPYFNVLMKNDQRYVYLRFENKPARHPLTIQYERNENSFGPFRRRYALQETLDLMEHFYPIYKARKYFYFDYHFFPDKMDAENYKKNQKALYAILTNPEDLEVFSLTACKKMRAAAKSYEFETANAFKNLVCQLKHVSKIIHSYESFKEKIIFADIPIQNGHKLFYIANGFVIHKSIVTLISDSERLAFIAEGKEKQIEMQKEMAFPMNEKGQIDYMNIIFSELQKEHFLQI